MVTLARLRLVRHRKALTQQQLAERAGVNRVTIVRLEGGTDEPLPTTVRKLATALDVEPEDLMEPGLQIVPNVPSFNAASGNGFPGNDEPGVRRLLRKTPGLASLVQEAAEQLVRFIPDARLSLKLITDPDEGESENEQIFLGISTDLQDDAALEALDNFDQEWWDHHVGRAHGLLCIDLEYE